MKKTVWNILFTLLIVGLLMYLLKDINFYEVYLLVAQANFLWFLAAVMSMAGTYVVWNYRWLYILKPYIKGDFWFFMKVLLAGSFFNTVTPAAGIGGEPFRAYYLGKKYKKPKTELLGYILGDSFFRIVVLFLFVFFSIFFILIYVNISNTLTLILESILAFIVLSIGGILYVVIKKLKFNLGAWFGRLHHFKFFREKFHTEKSFVGYVNRKLNRFSGTFGEVIKHRRNILVGLSLSFVFWGLNFLTAYFLFLSFGFSINFFAVIIVFTLGNVIGSVSPIPGGVGIVESSMTLLYSAIGIVPGLALLVAFLQRMIYYFFSLLVGGWCMVQLRKITNGGKFSLL